MNEKNGHSGHFVSFYLGQELFATNVSNVLEVLELQMITKVPKAPGHFRGVINFRGEILPVIETHKKIGIPQTPDTENTVIIVFNVKLENSNITIGAIADNVNNVFEVRAGTIKDIPEIGWRHNSEYLKGMVETSSGFVMILDMEKIISEDELTFIQN